MNRSSVPAVTTALDGGDVELRDAAENAVAKMLEHRASRQPRWLTLLFPVVSRQGNLVMTCRTRFRMHFGTAHLHRDDPFVFGLKDGYVELPEVGWVRYRCSVAARDFYGRNDVSLTLPPVLLPEQRQNIIVNVPESPPPVVNVNIADGGSEQHSRIEFQRNARGQITTATVDGVDLPIGEQLQLEA